MNSQEPEPLRIRQIRIEGLFGLYNHYINLNLKERVTILHGPNGVGKTITLRMIDALLEGKFEIFGQVPFRQFSMQFIDDSKMELQLSDKKTLEIAFTAANAKTNKTHIKAAHNTRLRDKAGLNLSGSSIHVSGNFGDNIIFNLNTGDEESSSTAINQNSDIQPRLEKNHNIVEPSWLTDVRERVSSHLIETQRLLQVKSKRTSSRSASTVIEYSYAMRQRIGETLTHYGQESQKLDQSFPQRLLTGIGKTLLGNELKNRMALLDNILSEFKKIGLLDDIGSHPFDLSELDQLDAAQNNVMMLYVQDKEQKLSLFEDLARRIKLLLDNINSKFKNKRLRIDREKGFLVTNDAGQDLELDSLSSGEQHEIVLLYDLLFRIKPNDLVLIDEPELSLHVVWQKRFLPDLLKIAEVAQIDVLIATHSPYIVGDYTNLMVALDTRASHA